MKKLVKAISGIGFLISGSSLMVFALSVLDWKDRVGQYGLFHELSVYSVEGVFWVAAVVVLIGVLLCVSDLLSNKE